MNEFKFFKGTTYVNINMLRIHNNMGMELSGTIGEVYNATTNLENRVRELEEQVTFMRDQLNRILHNEFDNL